MRLSGRRIIVSLLLLSTLVAGSAAAAAPASATTTFTRSASEARMGLLINRARWAAGRSGLAYSVLLSRRARAHSALMASTGGIFHTTNLAAVFSGFSWTIGGENVGMGPSMDALHAAFMASLHHRENNLDRRFHRFGIGVVWKNGVAFVTVDFLS